MNKLQVTQNKLLRVLGKRDRYYNSIQLHTDFDLLNIIEARDMQILKFVYYCLKGQPVEVFRDYFQIPTQIHNTRQADHISKDQINTEVNPKNKLLTIASRLDVVKDINIPSLGINRCQVLVLAYFVSIC